MEAVHAQFNCWEHCKFISHIVKFSCSVFVMESVTDSCLALDVNMSLYETYIMLNHTRPFANGAPRRWQMNNPLMLRLPPAEYLILML